jgi:hypothetical protein
LPTNIDIKILVLASNCRFVENKKIWLELKKLLIFLGK